jgi:hypothetical protein
MRTHPNVILKLTLTPDDLARKTYRAILAEANVTAPDLGDIQVGDTGYHSYVAEEDYNDSYQLSAPEGSIVVFRFVTYGYGEEIVWDVLDQQKCELEAWAKGICERHHCSMTISVAANYW